MKFIKTKKGIALLAVIAVVAISAVGAYAYFTSTGSGSGDATVGKAANDLVITATFGDNLLPGETTPVDVKIANPDGFGQAATSVSPDLVTGDHVTGVTVSNTGTISSAGTCTASMFHFEGDGSTPDSTLVLDGGTPVEIPANGSVTFHSVATGALVAMDDSGLQNACEGATVTFNLVSA